MYLNAKSFLIHLWYCLGSLNLDLCFLPQVRKVFSYYVLE